MKNIAVPFLIISKNIRKDNAKIIHLLYQFYFSYVGWVLHSLVSFGLRVGSWGLPMCAMWVSS